MPAVLQEVCQLVLETANSNDHGAGLDFGAHISAIDPIGPEAIGAALVPLEPHAFLGGASSSAPLFTTVRPARLLMQVSLGLLEDAAARRARTP